MEGLIYYLLSTIYYLLTTIVIDDLDDGSEGYLHNLAVGAFNFNTRRGEGLRSFHAAHDTAHAMTVPRDDLNIAFAIKRLQRRQSLGNFHRESLVRTRFCLTIRCPADFVNRREGEVRV